MEIVSRMKSNKEQARELRRQYHSMFKRGSHWGLPGKKRKSGGSSTAGSKKGETCKASSTKRFMAKYSRSYRDPGYAAWCEKWRGK